MALADIKQDLFIFFSKNDVFSMEENFDELNDLNILVAKVDKPLSEALIEKALEAYEEQKVVVKVEYDGKKAWVLDKPLEKYSQTIELSYPTLVGITKLINDYCEQTKNREARVDPLSITEGNLQDLLLIVTQMLNLNNLADE